jgi:hypothetical protein
VLQMLGEHKCLPALGEMLRLRSSWSVLHPRVQPRVVRPHPFALAVQRTD